MPRYSFKTLKSGKEVELFYPMDEAPSIGDEIDVLGMKLVRIPDLPQVDCKQDVHFTSCALPRWDKNADSHDAAGKPQFKSQKAVREYVAKSEGSWVYD
jgi:hypothetical protein